MRYADLIFEADEDDEAPAQMLFKVGDWVSSDIARDVGRVRAHEHNDASDMNFYSVQWNDGTNTQDVPEMTLKRAATPAPSSPKLPPIDRPAPEKKPLPPLVGNVIKGRAVVSIAPSEPVSAAAKLIGENNVGALPVLDGSDLVGIISERDIISKVAAHARDLRKTSVADVMTRNPVTIGSEDTLTTALVLMRRGNFRHLPITSSGRIIGVLSVKDIIASLLRNQE